jgi:BirA family biotin operon repressor/biotin-[acetyl-CoA-carboxylase] ligase
VNERRRAILDALAASDGPVAGPALADRLGISRAAVWNHVDALREAGFEIDSDDGYSVRSVPAYGDAAVLYGLAAPYDVEYHDRIASTNDRARELAAEGATDTVVLADEQTGGRGRRGRGWAAPSGAVSLSLVVRPDRPPAHAPLYTLAAAVAATDACREAGVDARIKWPNDVVVPVSDGTTGEGVGTSGSPYAAAAGEAKLAGILTEMEGEADRVNWLVVGVGVNANVDVDELPAGATSLRALVGNVDRRRFVQRFLERIHEVTDELETVVPAWRERTSTLGRRVRVETPTGDVIGEAAAVTEYGALVVETGDGEVTVHAGDCEHLRPVGADHGP